MVSENLKYFQDAFALYLSGAGEMKNEKEMWLKKDANDSAYLGGTIEFPTLTPTEVISRVYWKDGSISLKETCKNGEKHGQHLEWYENGKQKLHVEYKNGKLHGKRIKWNNKGEMEEEAKFKNNIKLYEIYYYCNYTGNTKDTKNIKLHYREYKNGQQCKFFSWYINGVMSAKRNYKNGRMHGKSTTWYENGTKKMECKYQDGLIQGKVVSYHKNGKKCSVLEYKNGKLIRTIK